MVPMWDITRARRSHILFDISKVLFLSTLASFRKLIGILLFQIAVGDGGSTELTA